MLWVKQFMVLLSILVFVPNLVSARVDLSSRSVANYVADIINSLIKFFEKIGGWLDDFADKIKRLLKF